MTWGFVTCGPNEALVVSGKLIFNYFEIDFNEQWIHHPTTTNIIKDIVLL